MRPEGNVTLTLARQLSSNFPKMLNDFTHKGSWKTTQFSLLSVFQCFRTELYYRTIRSEIINVLFIERIREFFTCARQFSSFGN